MLAQIDLQHLPILLIAGCALLFGGLGARLFQRLRIPQVVGYIVIGVVLGRSGLKIIGEDPIRTMRLFSFFALGVIGFMIGGELKLEIFRKYGKQFLAILFAEGLTAFLFVTMLTTLVGGLFTGQWGVSLALGLVLGAISSATAPAATVDVLWEYKTKGPLTTAVFALVAMDDGLALLLYGIAASVAQGIVGVEGGGETLWQSIGGVCYELGGAVVLGLLAGMLLNWILRLAREPEKTLIFILGMLIVVIGLALALNVDLILAAMALGMSLVNLAPRRSHESFKIVERFAPPIYTLFFVVVGARLSVGDMQGWMWALAAAFVIGRSGGKILGATLGAKWAKAASSVRKYLGLCLFSQAGVAIGLAILAGERLTGEGAKLGNMELGQIVLLVVTSTTFIVQIIGPPCVKLAVARAGEIGLNMTRDDLVAEYTVAEVMNDSPVCLPPNETFGKIMNTLSKTDAMSYPVTDEQGGLLGLVTLEHLKSGLGSEGLTHLLVAYDIMTPVVDTITPDQPLAEAMTLMRELELDYLPVVAPTSEKDAAPKLMGLLELRKAERKLSRELIRRQEAAADQEQSDLLREAINKAQAQK